MIFTELATIGVSTSLDFTQSYRSVNLNFFELVLKHTFKTVEIKLENFKLIYFV